MYTITKEKQFIYLTDDENNSKYIIDLQNQNIKNNRRQNTTLKNFPKSILDKGINTEVKNIDETSKYYSNFFYNFCQSDVRNMNILFKSLLITEKILSYYSFMNIFPTFSEELFFSKTDLKIFEENFSIIAQIIKNENYPLQISNFSLRKKILLYKKGFPCELLDTIINFIPDYYVDNDSKEEICFLAKVLKKAKIKNLKNTGCFIPNYVSLIKKYYKACEELNKTPEICNNMLREIFETLQTYQLFKEEEQNKNIAFYYKNHSKAWDFSFKDYKVVIPKSGMDLIIEGQKMHHCVGNYVNRIATNKTYIVFIRNKKNLDAPYLTAQVSTKGKLQQYYLAYDEKITSDEDKEFKKAFQNHLDEVWDLG